MLCNWNRYSDDSLGQTHGFEGIVFRFCLFDFSSSAKTICHGYNVC